MWVFHLYHAACWWTSLYLSTLFWFHGPEKDHFLPPELEGGRLNDLTPSDSTWRMFLDNERLNSVLMAAAPTATFRYEEMMPDTWMEREVFLLHEKSC